MVKKYNKKFKYIIILLLIILIILICILNKLQKKENIIQEPTPEQVAEIEHERAVDLLENMEERDRMEFYSKKFFEYIENEKYDKAYNLLYEEFKDNYFPTLEKFEEYSRKTFPEMANVRYDNIERNGDIYVLWIYISDAINGKPGEEQEMNIVIKENSHNDFVLSFSVI